MRFRRYFPALLLLLAWVVTGCLSSVEAADNVQISSPPRPSPSHALIRTIQLGQLEGIDAAEILELALDDRSQYHHYVLARAALLVLGIDHPDFTGWPMRRVLDRSLTQLISGSLGDVEPAGFRQEHLIYTLVYAMVMAGQERAAVDVLGEHLDTRVSFKRKVVLQALRYIGSRAANEWLQEFANGDSAEAHLATQLLADYHYPFLTELAQRWHELPSELHQQEALLQQAVDDPCGIPASLAVYFLGYYGDEAAQLSQQAVHVLTSLNQQDCFYTRFFARRALAQRSPQSLAYWSEQYVAERDPWQRAQLVRILWTHFPEDFSAVALDLLASEESLYVEWELVHGYFAQGDSAHGERWLSWWDLWFPPNIQLRLDLNPGIEASPAQVEQVCHWLEAGYRPIHAGVQLELLKRLLQSAHGESLLRALKLLETQKLEDSDWWILGYVKDPIALPQLESWLGTSQEGPQRAALSQAIQRLQRH